MAVYDDQIRYVEEGVLRINGRSVGIGVAHDVEERRDPIQGGGGFFRDWNGEGASTHRGSWRRFQIQLTFNGIVPPVLRNATWAGQPAVIESTQEESLDGYADLAVVPRRAPPFDDRVVMWEAVPGSFSFITVDGEEVYGDGSNALPAGYVPADISETLFRPILNCVVTEGLSKTMKGTTAEYSATLTLEEV